MSLYNLTESPSTNKLAHLIEKNREGFHPIVEFNPHSDKLINFDFTANNEELTEDLMNDTDKFSAYISNKLSSSGSRYGIGGYGELRTVYNRSQLFGGGKDEPRRVHLGTDIWGRAGEKIYVAIGGMVHSLAFNDHFGDYGATIILLHQLEGMAFYTLYGHLSLRDLEDLSAGNYVSRGQVFAHFGEPHENGHWPPHLHFQIIEKMGAKEGDYPGVCKYSEKEKWLANSPDPDLMLNLNRWLRRDQIS